MKMPPMKPKMGNMSTAKSPKKGGKGPKKAKGC